MGSEFHGGALEPYIQAILILAREHNSREQGRLRHKLETEFSATVGVDPVELRTLLDKIFLV